MQCYEIQLTSSERCGMPCPGKTDILIGQRVLLASGMIIRGRRTPPFTFGTSRAASTANQTGMKAILESSDFRMRYHDLPRRRLHFLASMKASTGFVLSTRPMITLPHYSNPDSWVSLDLWQHAASAPIFSTRTIMITPTRVDVLMRITTFFLCLAIVWFTTCAGT